MIDPNSSDWSDLDLLTFTEVRDRLTNEISALEHELTSLHQAASDPDAATSSTQVLQDRLNALRERLAQVKSVEEDQLSPNAGPRRARRRSICNAGL